MVHFVTLNIHSITQTLLKVMLCKLDTFATDQTTFCRVLSSCLFDRGIAKFRSFVRRFDARMISEIGILLLAFQSLVILNCDGLGCMSWMKSLLLCLFSRDTTSFWTSSNWSLNQYGYIFPARSSSCTGEFSTQEWSAKFINLFLLRSQAHTQLAHLPTGFRKRRSVLGTSSFFSKRTTKTQFLPELEVNRGRKQIS